MGAPRCTSIVADVGCNSTSGVRGVLSVDRLWQRVSYLCPRADVRSVRGGELHGGAGGRQAIRQCLLVLGPAPPFIDHPAQQALQGPHVDTLAVRDGARIDRAGCLRNFEWR